MRTRIQPRQEKKRSPQSEKLFMAGPEPVRVLYTGRLLNGVSKNALTAGRYSLVPAMRGGREQRPVYIDPTRAR